jgi:uncharacterized protein (TIGR02271 family)
MTITISGVFETIVEAREASARLEQAGIDQQFIRVETGSSVRAGEEHEDRRGFFEKLFGWGDEDYSSSYYDEAVRRGHSVLTVQLSDEGRADDVSSILESSGAIDVDERVEQWKATGYVAPSRTAPTSSGEGGGTMKSIQEDLKVGKRVVQKGRVRIHRTVTETPVEEQVSLRDERAVIERKHVDRPATEADLQTAFKDQDIEIRETTEEPVVSKSARVVEEVSVGKRSSERTETIRDSVRGTRIDIEESEDPIHRERSDSPVRYTGPERRISGSSRYNGPERRAAL